MPPTCTSVSVSMPSGLMTSPSTRWRELSPSGAVTEPVTLVAHPVTVADPDTNVMFP